MKKVALSFSFPIRVKRGPNGEKIIVPGDGRDSVKVKIVDDDNPPSKSWVVALHELLDQFEKEQKKARQQARKSKKF